MLSGRKIIVGICGSIAAYKSVDFIRELIKSGAEVRVMMTPSATQFVSPISLATLCGSDVAIHWITPGSHQWFNHVAWGLWADVILIAPASADTLARAVQGRAPYFLDGVLLSAKCPVIMAPAMDHDMFLHPATQENISVLKRRGISIIPPEVGFLASGLIGTGRLPASKSLIAAIENSFSKPLNGKVILITSGPTREPIDPVRFVSNYASGKMGTAIAQWAARMGARVIFISGPALSLPEHPNIEIHNIETALEMEAKTSQFQSEADWLIFTAAVADFRPKSPAPQKIKKQTGPFPPIEWEENPDILRNAAHRAKPNQIFVGFSLETNNATEYAQKKLLQKGADIICLNIHAPELNQPAFGSDSNALTIFSRNGDIKEWGRMSKDLLAEHLISYLYTYEK